MGKGARILTQMRIEHREQFRRIDTAADPLGQRRMVGHLLPQGGMGQSQHHQIGGGQDRLPVA